jgi:signal transduction histidine kinase/DNA-binding response OmpR family regulator
MGAAVDEQIEILVVEDSRTQAEQLRGLLEGQGYRVTVASNGREALAAIGERRPRLVISDVVMPEMDGYTLCQHIKGDESLRSTPVLLVTSLSSPHDIIRGLECGADNFLRKPYDEEHLLSRVGAILANQRLRASQKARIGVEVSLRGQTHFITAERQQILDLLISTYEDAVHLNEELQSKQKELLRSEQFLRGLYRIADGLNRCTSEEMAATQALEHALELPGVGACWLFLRNGTGIRTVLGRNLPPSLQGPGALEGDCWCKRALLSGELRDATNIHECERLKQGGGETLGLRYHASVPLKVGDRTLGVLNLVGSERGLFEPDDLVTLSGVGSQVAVALERARLLESLVERTAQLAAANKELEAFSYSVSHDLRAPLRAIDGFGEALQEECGSRLDPQGQRYLESIRRAAGRMRQLIDDLLDLARVARAEIRHDEVDLSALASAVAAQLQAAQPERQVDFVIAPGLHAYGDPRLLRLVFENLLGNAWKYTRKHPAARIEFGVVERAGSPVYLVRDDGAGFDMKYADKLFGAFQRLHTSTEFEGTGVGLATVQRIIHRHGGRIWAEAVIEKGATFWFTLGAMVARA